MIRSNVDRTALDQRIRFERQGQTQDETSGNVTVAWALVIACWAKVDAMPARERIAAGQLLPVGTYTFWVRADLVKRFGITPTMRIIWRGRPYAISDCSDQTQRARLTALVATGGLSEGD